MTHILHKKPNWPERVSENLCEKLKNKKKSTFREKSEENRRIYFKIIEIKLNYLARKGFYGKTKFISLHCPNKPKKLKSIILDFRLFAKKILTSSVRSSKEKSLT